MSVAFLSKGYDTTDSMMTGISMFTPALTAMTLLMMTTTWGGFDQVAAITVSPAVEYNGGIANRQLSSYPSCRNGDDALDPTKVG